MTSECQGGAMVCSAHDCNETIGDALQRCCTLRGEKTTTSNVLLSWLRRWLVSIDVFTVDELHAFLTQPDSLKLGQNPRFALWAAFIAEKFMKLLASEYSCLSLTSPDTSTLTSTVASLLQHKRFDRYLLSCLLRSAGVAVPKDEATGLGVRRVFSVMLTMVIMYKDLRTAARVVLPLFHELSHVKTSYVTEARAVLRAVHHTLFDQETPAACWDFIVNTLCERRVHLIDAAVLTAELQMAAAIIESVGNEAPAEVANHMLQWKLLTLKTTRTVVRDCLPPADKNNAFTSITAGQLWECRECFSIIRVTQRTYSVETCKPAKAEVNDVTCASYFQHLINCMQKYIAQQKEQQAAVNNALGSTANKAQPKSGGTVPITAREVANRLGEVLRFESPFDEFLRDSGVWHDVLRSQGWVPLRVVEACLMHWARLRGKSFTFELGELLDDLLLRHNTSGRYQLAVCSLEHSPFAQQLCARALYGHKITVVPLYHRILCHPPQRLAGAKAARQVPVCAWMQIDLKTLKMCSARVLLPVFTQRPMYILLPAKAIGMFGSYHDDFDIEQRFDVKLNHTAPLYFVEVYLRALIRDEEHVCVYERPATKHANGASSTMQWFVFSSYTHSTNTTLSFTEAVQQLSNPEAMQVDCGGLPKVFLSGRIVRLDNGGCGTDAKVEPVNSEFGTLAAQPGGPGLVMRSCTITLNKLPDSVLPPHVRQDGLRSEAASSAALAQVFPPDRVAALFADTPDHRHADEVTSADGVLEIQIAPTAASVPRYLDLRALQKEVEEFCADTTRDVTRLEVPLCDRDGTNFSDRQQYIEELKTFLTRRGLIYRLVSCPASAKENLSDDAGEDIGNGKDNVEDTKAATQVYEIRKRPAWNEVTLREVAAALGLDAELECHLLLLRAALTRECESKTNNYELLEFIGDALMDFIVMLDTCTLDVVYATSGSVPKPTPPLFLCGSECHRNDVTSRVRVPPMQLGYDVVSKVCKNKVLAQLLPPVVKRHFDDAYGVDLHYKVLADVFEAMLGAVYRAELGLGTVRRVLRRLFSDLPARLCTARTAEDASGETIFDLNQACKSCPYVYDTEGMLERLRPLTEMYVIDAELQARYGLHSFSVTQMSSGNHQVKGDDEATVMTGSSHDSVTCFPRIQVKQYATHFTSGWAFSFRRLPALDAPRVFNRLLTFSQQGLPTYMNEIITEMTHFVVDFDGANVRSWGVTHLLWRWACETFGRPLPMLLLDCSGLSVLKETKYKHSCHIHFAQAAMDLPTLQRLQNSLRDYITRNVAARISWCDQSKGAVTDAPIGICDATPSDPAVGDLSGRTVRPKYVILCTASYVARQLGKLPTCTTWSTIGRRHVWGYCNFEDLVRISHTCHLWRRSAFEYVAERMQAVRTLAPLFGILQEDEEADGNLIVQGEESDNAAMAVVEAAGHSTQSGAARATLVVGVGMHTAPRRVMLPECWLPHIDAKPNTKSAAIDEGGTSIQRQLPNWADVVDAGLIASRKLRMFTCDKWDQIYGTANRPLHLDTMCLPVPPRYARQRYRAASPSAGQSRQSGSHTRLGWQELRVERMDRSYYTDEAQTRHRQRAATVAKMRERCQRPVMAAVEANTMSSPLVQAEQSVTCTGVKEVTIATANKTTSVLTTNSTPQSDALWNFEEEVEYPVEVARASTLQLTSLRCPRYRDVWGLRHDAWDPTCATGETGTDDSLPRFDAVMAASQRWTATQISDVCPTRIVCRSWRVWINCLLCATPSKIAVTDKTLAPALLPTWWAYSTETRTATFYVASEPALRVADCSGLGDALYNDSKGCGGMRCLAHYLIPHLDYSKTEMMSTTCADFPPNVLPLYLLPGLQRTV